MLQTLLAKMSHTLNKSVLDLSYFDSERDIFGYNYICLRIVGFAVSLFLNSTGVVYRTSGHY